MHNTIRYRYCANKTYVWQLQCQSSGMYHQSTLISIWCKHSFQSRPARYSPSQPGPHGHNERKTLLTFVLHLSVVPVEDGTVLVIVVLRNVLLVAGTAAAAAAGVLVLDTPAAAQAETGGTDHSGVRR